MSKWIGISVVLCGVAAGAAARPSPHEKLVKELYGKRIAKARASADPADNISLARELTLAAAETANPAQVRHILAMEAVKLTAAVGTVEAAGLAREALSLADKMRRLERVEKCRLELKISRGRYTHARRSGTSGAPLVKIVRKVVDAEVGLAEALIEKNQLRDVDGLLKSAGGAAGRHGLIAQAERIEQIGKELRALRVKLGRIRNAEARLKRARLIGDKKGIRTANRQLGTFYLLLDGDLVKASTYLAGTGDKYESLAAAAAKYLRNPKRLPPADQCNDLVENLCKVAKEAENRDARVRIARVATDICRAFIATKPRGLAGTKARLLLRQAEALAEDTAAHRFIGKLKTSYGGLSGKLEVPKPGIVRASYDFASASHILDWTVQEGPWQVLAGKDILAASPKVRGRARLESRLRFRADKPLTFSFRASGQQDLNAVLFFRLENDPRYGAHGVYFCFGANGNRESHLKESGWQCWSDRRLKVLRNRPYRIDIAWDGAKKLTWSINGKVIREHQLTYFRNSPAHASLFPGLETGGKPAGFDDVKIEGTVLENPSQRLARPKSGRRRGR